MSGKTNKKLRRLARKAYRYHYNEFLEDVSKIKLFDRLRIAWQVIKGGKDG